MSGISMRKCKRRGSPRQLRMGRKTEKERVKNKDFKREA
jgi:hypothetical protein